MRNIVWFFIASLFGVYHYNITGSTHTYRQVGQTAIDSLELCYRIQSLTGDTTEIAIRDTASSTAYTKGDSVIMPFTFASYGTATLNMGCITSDTNVDSLEVFQNHKLIYVLPLATTGNAEKGNHQIAIAVTPGSPGTVERFVFTTRMKKAASKSASTKKWYVNYLSQ